MKSRTGIIYLALMVSLLFALTLVLAPAADAQGSGDVYMYNDTVGPASGSAPNVTHYSGYLGGGGGFETPSGFLKDYASGLDTSITVAMEASNVSGSTGAMPNAGTDAFAVFDGIVKIDESASYGSSSSAWYYKASFSGLNPAKTYEFVTTANRNGSSYSGDGSSSRWTEFSILGADSYTNASSTGVVEVSPGVLKMNTGYNTVDGNIIKWTGITAADGTFEVLSQNVGTAGPGEPIKSYGMQAFLLIETEGAVSPQLSVAAPNGALVQVFKGSSKVAEATVTTENQVTMPVEAYDAYKVKVKQGAAWFEFDGIDCDGGPCALDAFATVTVEAPGNALVQVFKGSAKAIEGTVGDAATSISLNVVKYDNYEIKVKQGAAWFEFAGNDCSSGTCGLDALTDVTVQAPDASLVQVFKGSAKTIEGTISGGTSINLPLVTFDSYKIMIRQGAAWFEFTGNDCDPGPCELDALTSLIVEAPEDAEVQVFRGSAKASSGVVDGSKSIALDVVTYNDYKIKIKQGAAWFELTPNDCSDPDDACSRNALATLTVEAPAGALVQVFKGSAKATSGDVDGTKSISLDVVKYDDFKIKIKQGAAWFEFGGNDCGSGTCSLNALCSVTLTAPQNALVQFFKGSAKAVEGTVGPSETITFDVVRYNNYTVKIKVGSTWYTTTGVDAFNSCPVVSSNLKVWGPSTARVTVNGSSRNIGWDRYATYNNLPNGLYSVTIMQNKDRDDFPTYTETVVHFGSTTLQWKKEIKALFPQDARADVEKDGVKFVGGTKSSSRPGATFEVVPGIFDVVFTQESATYRVNGVDVRSSNQTIDGQCDLLVTVNKSKGQDAHIYLPNTTDVVVQTGNVGSDGWALFGVVKGTYDVASAGVTIEDVDCTGENQSVTFP